MKVVEVINADALVLKTAVGDYRKVTLSSIRPPRLSQAPKEGKEDGKEVEQPRVRITSFSFHDIRP